MSSKRVMDREKTASALSGILESFGEKTAEAVRAVLAPFGGAGDGLPDLAEFQELLGQRLEILRASLVEADESHLREQKKDRALRLERDRVARELASRISRLRYVVEQSCGLGTCQRLWHVNGPLPRDPVPLRRVAQRVLHHLRSDDFQLPASELPGVFLDGAAWITFLEDPLLRLTAAIEGLPRERAKTTAAQVAKNELMDEYDRIYQFTARLVEDLFRYAGRTAMAKAVRPSRHRRPIPPEAPVEKVEAENGAHLPGPAGDRPPSTLPEAVLSKTVS